MKCFSCWHSNLKGLPFHFFSVHFSLVFGFKQRWSHIKANLEELEWFIGMLGTLRPQYLAKLPRLTNCSPVRKYQFQCFPDHFDFWFLKFVESNIVTSTKPSSKLMDCGFFRGMLWSVVPRSCGWVSLSLNLPLKAAKITQQSIDCVVGSAGSNFCSRPIISDLLGLSEHSDLIILFTWVHPGFGQTTPRIKWFNAWSFDKHILFFPGADIIIVHFIAFEGKCQLVNTLCSLESSQSL